MTNPPNTGPLELSYQSANEHGNAPILVKLAGIFNIIAGGIDVVYAIGMLAAVLLMFVTLSKIMALPPPPPPVPVAPAPAPALPPGPGAPAATAPAAPAAAPAAPLPAPPVMPTHADMIAVYLTYGLPGALSLLASIFKITGGIKLLRRRKNAWPWGLTCGIVGCIELWTFMPCCVTIVPSMACGVYTLVIVCLPHVRNYLMVEESRNA